MPKPSISIAGPLFLKPLARLPKRRAVDSS
jgi:hypothetical protein